MLETTRKKTQKETSFHQMSSNIWLISFSDLLSLLVAFFVMRYSMYAMDSNKWDRVASSVRTAMHAKKLAPINQDDQRPLTLRLGKALERTVPRNSDGIAMTLRDRKSSLSIELSGSIFFGDTDELTFSGKERLRQIGALLKDQKVSLEVTAYATLTADSDSQFASPWDLSAAWAGTTARQMIDAGVATSVISAAGLADIQQDEDKESKTPTRRIEIAITLRE